MLVPNLENVLINNNKNEKEDSILLKVNVNDYIDFRELYVDVFDDEKALTEYTKMIVKMVRSSYEYRQYIKILKSEFDLTKCAFFNNIDIADVGKISFEMHHYPFTIFDIISIIIQNRIEEQVNDPTNQKKFDDVLNPFSIAKETLRLHYEGKVGLVPLTITPHELYHAGELFIPLTGKFVFGNYDKFIEEYNALEYGNYKSVLKLIEDKTTEILEKNQELDLSKLQIKKVYLQMDNVDFLEKIKLEEDEEKAA